MYYQAIIEGDMMARKGRELEKIVSRLEKSLNDSNFEIKSPDFIEDRNTGMKREVDISLRGTVCSHSLLIILECRDRKGKQDVTWIEQLASKRNDIGAHKAIAVSSAGFTGGAIKKAESYDIELRTLDEIDHQKIIDWFKPESYTWTKTNFRIIKGVFSIMNRDQMETDLRRRMDSILENYSPDSPLLLQKGLNKPISLNELFKMINGLEELFAGLNPSSGIKTYEISLVPEEPRSYYQLLVDEKTTVKIDKIIIDVKIWQECKELAVDSIKEYKEGDQVIGHIIRTKPGNLFGPNQSLESIFLLKGDGCRQVGLRIVDLSLET